MSRSFSYISFPGIKKTSICTISVNCKPVGITPSNDKHNFLSQNQSHKAFQNKIGKSSKKVFLIVRAKCTLEAIQNKIFSEFENVVSIVDAFDASFNVLSAGEEKKKIQKSEIGEKRQKLPILTSQNLHPDLNTQHIDP